MIQKGDCNVDTSCLVSGLHIEAYDYKDSISGDLNSADLVISHAGQYNRKYI